MLKLKQFEYKHNELNWVYNKYVNYYQLLFWCCL